MSNRQTIQCVSIALPLRHESVKQRGKTPIVRWLYKMQQLMNDNVLQTLSWLFSKLRVQADCACYRVATAHFVFIL